jgi:hypothetical protein
MYSQIAGYVSFYGTPVNLLRRFISLSKRFFISLLEIAYVNGRFVAGGSNGKMAYSSMEDFLAKLVFNQDGSVSWVRG